MMVVISIDTHKQAGGGYPLDSDPSSNDYQDIINAHADVYVQAAEFFGAR
jgi:hypothetical protein